MIASMTGFAASARETAAGQIAIELKSVNHRYLEFQCRMPDELRVLEAPMREAVTAKLVRGKVDCRLTYTPRALGPKALEPNAQAMASLQAAAAGVLAAFPQARPLSVSEVLHWPGVLADVGIPADLLKDEVMASLEAALRDLNQTRQREGAKLAQILAERLDHMGSLVEEARPLMPASIRAFQEKLTQKIAEAAGAPMDERVQQEVVLYAARIDVDEELSRLTAHLAEFRRVLQKGGAAGKRLDFLCQELNREANTLGSKSVASDTSRISVELKVLIEQMREQVQNIE